MLKHVFVPANRICPNVCKADTVTVCVCFFFGEICVLNCANPSFGASGYRTAPHGDAVRACVCVQELLRHHHQAFQYQMQFCRLMSSKDTNFLNTKTKLT